MANWANDLVRGFGQGASINATIDQTAERRKKAKSVATIGGEMDKSIFDVEDKGPISNFFYDKFGIGDAPKITNKAGAAPAPEPAAPAAAVAEPLSDARAMAARGADALRGLQAGSETGPAPEMLAMQEIGITPIQPAQYAAPTPAVPVSAIPVEELPPSRYRKQAQQGIS